MRFIKKHQWHLFLLLAVIIGYWQLSFMLKIMKWDMMMYYFPMKYYIGECISNGFLPLWNPHQFLGYPIHADPQSSAFYPITWIIGGVFGYNFYTIHIDFLLHIFIAGLGMMTLGKKLKLMPSTSFLMAVSYAFCGVMIGNAQHFSWIISAAWIPFIISSIIEMKKNNSYNVSIITGFYIFLFLTGGYSAFFIITFYSLAIYIIIFLLNLLVQKNYLEFLRFIKRLGIMTLSFLILSSGYLISIFKVLPYFSRSKSINLESILQNPFPFKSFISFIFPFATTTQLDFWGTDMSMSNAYFGLIALLILFSSLILKNNRKQLILILLSIIFLATAVGNELPMRALLVHHVPGMGLFRHPSVFRYFALFCLILSMGYSLNEIIRNFNIYKKRVLYLTFLFCLFLILMIFYHLPNVHEKLIFRFVDSWMKMKPNTNSLLSDNLVIQSLIHLAILTVLIIILLVVKRKKLVLIFFIILFTSDLIISTQLNLAASAISNRNFAASQKGFTNLQHGFSISNYRNKNIDETKKEYSNQLDIYGLYSNLNIFDKQVSYDGYNPFQLSTYESIKETPYFNQVIKNKLVYLSDSILPIDKIGCSNPSFDNLLFVDQKIYEDLAQLNLDNNMNDTVHITLLNPNSIAVNSDTKHQQIITLLQNDYPGWEVYLNSEKTKYFTSNKAFISFLLPQGKNTINYVYKPVLEVWGFRISIVAFFIFIAYFLYGYIKKTSFV